MNSYLDDALVGALLLLSAGYACAALGPRTLRRRVLAACSAALRRAPAMLGLRQAAEHMARAAESKSSGACGGCDNCASETPGAGDAKGTLPTEINVPIAGIGRIRR
jgi:hypothetical protein